MSQVRIIPLGGCGEIGKNMTVVRQGDEILVLDAGLSFPTEEMHGVDLVIPDFAYLRENAGLVRGIVLTHGHEDHVGALPYVLAELSVPVYGTELTLAFVRRKLDEKLPQRTVDLRPIESGNLTSVGSFEIEPIHVTHSLPDSCAIAVRTDLGVVLFSGDFKFDFTPIDNRLTELSRFGELGDEGVVLLLSDCTNVEFSGWSPSERTVTAGFRRVFSSAPGRILITTFASNLHRMQQAFDVAAESGRKVAAAGRRMEQTIGIARALGRLRVPEDTYVDLGSCDSYRDDEIVILTTGAQGEPMAALSLMAKDEYPRTQIRPGDTVIYSARPIPGNEAAIWQTVNRLFRQGANVIYGPDQGVHVSGHGYREELKMLINLTKPNYVAPVHGEPRHQHHYAALAKEMGYDEENIVTLENGMQLVLEKEGAFLAESVSCGRVLVDSGGYAGLTDEHLRDRGNLARDGILFINVAIDSDAGKVVGISHLIAKGVLVPDGEMERLRHTLLSALGSLSSAELKDVPGIQREVNDLARRHFKKEMNKHPLVVASVIDV